VRRAPFTLVGAAGVVGGCAGMVAMLPGATAGALGAIGIGGSSALARTLSPVAQPLFIASAILVLLGALACSRLVANPRPGREHPALPLDVPASLEQRERRSPRIDVGHVNPAASRRNTASRGRGELLLRPRPSHHEFRTQCLAPPTTPLSPPRPAPSPRRDPLGVRCQTASENGDARWHGKPRRIDAL